MKRAVGVLVITVVAALSVSSQQTSNADSDHAAKH